ncbi:MAG: peptide chain release factor N(5)-glutamine methyltransferase [Acidobacteriota bacterium]|nr:peptide chain release factor N(5)-glutamine methyltransferase [Acidobacteriota bacterium]
MNLHTALLQGAKLLEDGRILVPRLTAEVLLCHAVQCERPYLYAHPEQELREVEWLHYGRYLHQRLEGKPTQYITQKQEFYGREFRVNPDVLIPRPETEHVIEAVLKLDVPNARMVDVGCGSGAIAVTLALECPSVVMATDISPAALAVASVNARKLGARVEFLACDILSAISDQSIDVIASNPPYVALGEKPHLQREVRDWEPDVALFAGPTGFEIYERLIADAARVLRPLGWLVVELGFRAHRGVSEMVSTGWTNHRTTNDLAGIPRVLACQKAN